jgi:methionine-rich copper-binding protein CopC
MTRMNFARALAAITLVVGTFAFSPSAPANATTLRHTSLEKAAPGVNDTITLAPTALKLWFNEKVDLKAVQLRLQMEGGPIAMLGGMVRDSLKSEKSVVVPILSDVDPGTYRVTWAVAGADGHPVQGRFAFVLKTK